MRFPISLYSSLAWYLLKRKVRGEKIFPLVLMLEPTHQCNLNCQGCGKIREYVDTRSQSMALDECLQAVEASRAPVISICGGEPLLYPEIKGLVEGILKKKRHIHLCTNAFYLSGFLCKFKPNPRLNINVHLDGLAESHNSLCGQKGVFERAIQGIREAKKRGFRVITNTTIYQNTSLTEIKVLFSYLTSLRVDGFLLAPGYHWPGVEKDLFLEKEEIFQRFRALCQCLQGFRVLNSPGYLKLLRGEITLPCTPWGNITRNPQGWKSPCYLITDAHYPTYQELIGKTEWQRYRRREDPRCAHCLMHSGFEATVALEGFKHPRDLFSLIRWNLFE
ncbi:MAG: adenosyl-hopene transferase HpnH [Candidatus Tectomicrobia bacterium]|uniref:Adenosyl-hopene transferase HpnH n=1 Tax=Tectimicrobiota bacterium TaxID=2528274 RepID=A0A932CND7_UNCTE|nr:adenosyl-hopene transferase HpnH [Candidatus Tectomicrobia bacterium]